MSKKWKAATLDQEAIDEIVPAQADDDSAWEPPIFDKPIETRGGLTSGRNWKPVRPS